MELYTALIGRMCLRARGGNHKQLFITLFKLFELRLIECRSLMSHICVPCLLGNVDSQQHNPISTHLIINRYNFLIRIENVNVPRSCTVFVFLRNKTFITKSECYGCKFHNYGLFVDIYSAHFLCQY